MDVRFWGPQLWSTMDFLAFNYPVSPSAQDRKNMKQFYAVITQMLPCQSCREHFTQLLQQYPLEDHLDSRDSLTRWLVEAHNRVNERLGKPRVAYEVVAQKYQQMRGTCEMGKLTPAALTCPAKHPSALWILLTIVLLIMLSVGTVWWFKQSRGRTR